MWETLVILALSPSLVHCQMSNTYNAQGWKMAGEYLSQYMDRTVSPCNDVAIFMCSSFGNSSTDKYQSYREEKTSKLLDSLVEAIQSDPKCFSVGLNVHAAVTASKRSPRPRNMHVSFTSSIPNVRALRTIHLRPMKPTYQVLKDALGEFPPFEEATNSTTSDTIWYLMGRMQQRLGQYVAIQSNIYSGGITLSTETATQPFPREYFRNQTLTVAHSLNRTIDETYLELLLDETEALYEDWSLSSASKERINKKLDAIKLNPAIPSWIMDDKKVVESQHTYNASRSLFMSFIIKSRENFLSKLDRLLKGPDIVMPRGRRPGNQEQEDPPPSFEQNSYFSPNELKISIMLGYTLPPTFSLNYPLSVKYGRLGALIGHELNHAFDSEGVRSGLKGGNLLEKDEQEIYDRQANCLVSQYSQNCYKKLGQCISGTNAITDNIADIGGLKAAYGAYVMANGVLGDEPPIPGLHEYSHDQILFMTYERWFCTRNTPPEVWMSADHTPDASRGPVALKNNPHFAAVFECPVASAAAPIRPCQMWGDFMDSPKSSR